MFYMYTSICTYIRLLRIFAYIIALCMHTFINTYTQKTHTCMHTYTHISKHTYIHVHQTFTHAGQSSPLRINGRFSLRSGSARIFRNRVRTQLRLYCGSHSEVYAFSTGSKRNLYVCVCIYVYIYVHTYI